ncbi:Panacea domain-containing protein [Thiobacillus sp.]
MPNSMVFDGRAIANYILDWCDQHGRPVTNLALQKIVYFCHVWTLLKLQKPLVKHRFEAWQHGPVLQYLYQEFKQYDREPITGRALAIDLRTGKKVVARCSLDEATGRLLDQVIDFYSQLGAGYLVDLSHVSGGPWDTVWNHGGNINPGMKIDNDEIIVFYSKAMPQFGIQ